MLQPIEAIYEDGVIKPMEEVNLKEHERIKIFITEEKNIAEKSQGIVKGNQKLIEDVALNPEYSCVEE